MMIKYTCAIVGWLLVLETIGHQKVGAMEDCGEVKCPKLRCPKKLQVKEDGECCKECQCLFRKRNVKPGHFCEKGRSCECQDGKVQCKYPKCPLRSLDCVDYVEGEDCCYHCPNGRTCMVPSSPKTVIKSGEYKISKKSVCACAGEPWYPYAFCAPRKVDLGGLKTYRDLLVPYMKVE